MAKRGGLASAAGFIMLAMVVSRVLGYVRDMVIYARFGQNAVTDAYNAAFSIPDFLYMLLVGGALSSAFIPVFSGYLATNKQEDAWKTASTVFNLITLLMAAGITLGYIFTPQLIYALVPGFAPETTVLTVKLTRIMFIQTFFMALTGLSMGILNAHQHFTSPAIGAILYNLGIIVVGAALAPYLGIAGFSIGVVVGAVANFAVQVPALIRHGLHYHFSLDLRHPGVRRIGTLILPVLVGLSVTQLNLFVNQNLASSLPAGTVAVLRTGQRLMQLPIGIFAVAVGVAVFPTLTGQAAREELENYRRTLASGLKAMLFIMIPAQTGLAVLRMPLISLLFEQGQFTAANTAATSVVLLFYCAGIFAYGSIQLLNRAFYALQDTRTPVIVAIITIAANIILNLLLVRVLGAGGLALAYSLAGVLNVLLLVILIGRRVGGLGRYGVGGSVVRSLMASLLMAVLVSLTADYVAGLVEMGTKMGQAIVVTAGVGVGVLVYLLASVALGQDQLALVSSLFRRR
ncbi:MAG: murein biosynthesis integral membrane protein MurJ [Clostridia bacterium]|nr:MAG: murein biosynthesis integral membrane protein MurJ [Clostridia bacterium]